MLQERKHILRLSGFYFEDSNSVCGWGGGEPASLDEQVSVSVLKREEMRGEDRNRDTACVCVCDVYRFCVHTCSGLTCLSGVGPAVCPGLRLVFRCVCTLLCFIQLSVLLLLLLTWPPLFSCPPDRQYARAPPQSFIGSYCHRTQIQYASIDCVEMQSGSPQQRSKQSKFNRTPPPAFSPALIAPP